MLLLSGVSPGEEIQTEGTKRQPDKQQLDFNAFIATVQHDLCTDGELRATYKGTPWVTSRGPITVKSIKFGAVAHQKTMNKETEFTEEEVQDDVGGIVLLEHINLCIPQQVRGGWSSFFWILQAFNEFIKREGRGKRVLL